MNSIFKFGLMSLVLVTILMLGMSQSVFAAGTAAGTAVNNEATITYSVNSITQPTEADTTRFVVDRKIDLSMTYDTNGGSALEVTPGQTNQVIQFTLTNNGNDTQDYAISATQLASGGTFDGNTDNIDIATLEVSLDNSTWSTTADVNDLAADGTQTIYVRAALIDASWIDDDFAGLYVLAETADASTGVVIASDDSGDGDLVDTVQNVFADGSSDDDADNDGAISARGGYLVVSAEISISKTSTVVWDPVNLTTDPKAIPGATVKYILTIENSGSQTADLTTIVDTLDGNTTYTESADGASTPVYTNVGGTITDDDAPGGTLTFSGGTIAAGATATIEYFVSID